MPAAAQAPLTVFYDGGCPLCRREIGWYRRRRALAPIEWLDVSRCPDTALPDGHERQTLLARFHVALPDGRVTSGAAAFLAVWLRYPGLRWGARLASIPPLPWLLERGYRVFLRVRPRLQRRASCSDRCA
jgi:predicted DCC family thiol-disulfide oxidoreductase YuxK